MLDYIDGLDPEEKYSDGPVMFSAYDQTWDYKTRAQLRNEYNVIYNGGIWAYMKIGTADHPLVAVGFEDDGTIQFPRQYGQFTHCFSPYWIDSIISGLQDMKKLCETRAEIE